ncbi:MAG TPA: helix-turn-helix transcriptional regulator [Thermoanaerobaculia bacterium]|jgi:hypothetical protein|nr:helix-turn-helix transcriptional regulator [Thermoanaerobaculia bacterium]
MSVPDLRPDWRDRLRYAVNRSGRKQSAIAWDAGITPETLSRILNAGHIEPRFSTVLRIVRALDVELAWVVGDPPGVTMTKEQRKLLYESLEIMERIVNALEDGTLVAISPPRKE